MKNIILIIYNYLMLLISPFSISTKIYSDEELIKYVKNNNLSLIRFGDGEYRLMYSKKSIHYQKFDNNLQNELLNIFNDYKVYNNKYLICIPNFFMKSVRWFLRENSKFIMCFAKPRLLFRLKQNKSCIYGDAFVFGKGKEDIYSKLWADKDNIILIHNNKKWVEMFNNKYDKKALFIKTLSKNSYKIIDEVEKKVLSVENISNYIVLVSSGPMAKALAYRLSKHGIQVIDTGHFIDDPLV